MQVCHCHGVNDKQIKAAVEAGAETLRDLHRELKIGKTCGRCLPQARRVLEQTLLQISEPQPKETESAKVVGF